MEKNFTKGSILRALVAFSIPYLLSCFLQTFYGMADLYVTGQYNGAAAISAVSIGSQVMHMITVVIVGLAMGTTVLLGQAVGEKNKGKAGKLVGNTVVLFLAVSHLYRDSAFGNTADYGMGVSTKGSAGTDKRVSDHLFPRNSDYYGI